jgi:hypothetical protein
VRSVAPERHNVKTLYVCLTFSLSGRGTTCQQRRGRTLTSGARGAGAPTRHAPLQRLLGIILSGVLGHLGDEVFVAFEHRRMWEGPLKDADVKSAVETQMNGRERSVS